MRTAEYEIIEHTKHDSVVARLWWDGRRVQCSDPQYLEFLKRDESFRFKNSEEWLHHLPLILRNGYIMARKARK